MANKQKKTQKEMYNELLALCQTDEQRKFIESRLEQLAKKTANKKLTEKQKANQQLTQEVYDYMQEDKMYTITELMKEVPAFQEIDALSNQFANYIVKLLKDSGRVTRVVEKGRAKFVKVVKVEGE